MVENAVLALLAVFLLYPAVDTLVLSFQDARSAGWVGLANYRMVFNDPAFREKFLAPNFIYSIVSSPDEFAERIRRESAKWGKVIKDAGVKVD